MQLSRRIALDGVQLDGLDGRILISEVYEMPGDKTATAAAIYDGTGVDTGSRVNNVHRNSKKVRCKFRINYKRPFMAERAELLDRINGWSLNGGMLTIGARPGQRMKVRCQQELEVGDLRDWTREYTIIFEANEKPFWENATEESAESRTGASGSVTLGVKGNLPNVLSLDISNKSGSTINKMTISTGDYKFEFTNLALAANEHLVIDHTSKQVLRIRIRSAAGSYRSVLAKRTEESDDELRVTPGRVTVSYTADRAVTLLAKCWGRYA